MKSRRTRWAIGTLLAFLVFPSIKAEGDIKLAPLLGSIHKRDVLKRVVTYVKMHPNEPPKHTSGSVKYHHRFFIGGGTLDLSYYDSNSEGISPDGRIGKGDVLELDFKSKKGNAYLIDVNLDGIVDNKDDAFVYSQTSSENVSEYVQIDKPKGNELLALALVGLDLHITNDIQAI